MIITKKFFLPIISVAITVFFTRLCIKDLFNDVALEQMLWHVKNAELLAEGYTDEFKIFRYVITAIFYITIVWAIFTFDNRIAQFCGRIFERVIPKNKAAAIARAFLHFLEVGCGICALVYLGHFAPEVWQITKMHLYPEIIADNKFIEINSDFSASSQITFPDGKNNLVCVLVESLEDSFEIYIPNLNKLRELGISLDNMQAVHGTTWTIAAQTAWHFGLPLKTPLGINRNRYITKDGFLPNAISIFDILAKNGYKCVLVMGTDATFGGAELLFSRHGKFEVRDKKYFRSKGYDLEQYQGTEWGYSDKFVLNMGFAAYKELVTQNSPFSLFIATIDTHSPTGYAPPNECKFGDIRDAIIAADKNVSQFVREILAIPEKHDKLAIAVIGDHEYMGLPDFLKEAKNRRIYNFFAGNIPSVPDSRLTAPFSALDIAPTLLQMSGGRWPSEKFGLGVSLFSNSPSLLQTVGRKELDKALGDRSSFYEKLY